MTHKERNKRWYEKNREKILKQKREYGKNHRKQLNEYMKKYRIKIRMEVLKKLGGKCVRCGFSDIRALQIDHVHGGGLKEVKKLRKGSSCIKFYRKIINDVEGNYQLLCANCNWIKKYENNEVTG